MKRGIYWTFRMDDPFFKRRECLFLYFEFSHLQEVTLLVFLCASRFGVEFPLNQSSGEDALFISMKKLEKWKECFLNIWINLNCGRFLPNTWIFLRLIISGFGTWNPYLNNVNANSHLFCSHSISRYAKYYEHPRQVIKNASRTGIFTNIGESISHW